MSLKAPLFSLALLAAVVGVFTPAAVAQADGFTCRASALRVTSPAATFEPVVANAANNPCADASAGPANAAGPGVAAGALTAQTDAQPSGATSTASVGRVAITVGGIPITAELLRSNAAVTCTHGVPFHPGRPAFSGSSSVAALSVGGTVIAVTGQPNQTITLGGVTIVINEQIQQPDRITVRALRVSFGPPLSTEVVVAESIADVSGHHPCA